MRTQNHREVSRSQISTKVVGATLGNRCNVMWDKVPKRSRQIPVVMPVGRQCTAQLLNVDVVRRGICNR
ncbi:MAG: hypothetical protein ACRD2S_03410 [Terriglobales bacterium]